MKDWPAPALPDREEQLIASAVQQTCTRAENDLDIAGRKAVVAQPCQACGGLLECTEDPAPHPSSTALDAGGPGEMEMGTP
ncbi:hypothetical protein GCM10023097_77710 [Streptomyces collinus]